MSFHEIVIREIERDRSFKILKFFAECIREAGQAAAVHTESVILLFNVRRGNAAHVGHSRHDGLLNFDHFRRAVTDLRVCVDVGECVGF